MARARSLKPGFFKNETLCELPPIARLLFAGLWTIADREGRLEDRPKRIKAEVLPYDKCNVDDLLNALHCENFIQRYSVDGSDYIAIPSWHKHQRPHIKEVPSTIPAPTQVMPSTAFSETGTGNSVPETPSSYNLNPEPLTVNQRFDYDTGFLEVWNLYPKKGRTKKTLAESAYCEQVSPDPERIHAAIIDGIKSRWIPSQLWAKGFVTGITDFIALQRWTEEPEPAEKTGNTVMDQLWEEHFGQAQ